MVFKLNISNKGKSWKLDLDSEVLIGRKIGDKFNGKEVSPDLEGYELEITGASDIAGFPHKKGIEGPEIKRVLLKRGWGMHKKPKKEGKKKVSTPNGLRLRKSIRGEQISDKTVQVNIIVSKEGKKKLAEVFPDQNKVPEPEKPTEEVSQSGTQESVEQKAEQEVKEEIKEEIKKDIPTSPETRTSDEKEDAAEKIAEEVVEESKEAIDESVDKK